MALRLISIIIVLLFSSTATSQPDHDSSYLTTIRQELARLSLSASCREATDTCVFDHTINNQNKKFTVYVRFSKATNTVYIFVEKFLTLNNSDGPSTKLSRYLLDLNRQMVTAKFEWDKTTNSIRLSASLNTDSNFDRKAFRSQVRGLLANMERLWPKLHTIDVKLGQ